MTALAADRNTARMEGDLRVGGAAAVLIYAGALVMRNSSGYVTKGATATGAVGCGRAEERVDNSGGSAGDLDVRYRPGIFRFANSASTDLIGITEIGKPCYVVDDQTVAKTDGTASRSIAGFVEGVDDLGVWVRLDETLAQAYVAGVTKPA
ncbi:MAG: hypothetical protein BGN87_06265 [Rhizobiales bacterium 65-79]|jgi:hypothetical protein|nr:hypothetical protein [Hyphomicrobiales bacterium]OJU02795.1 MAG: hypothetical protein BGN87_06265 [Rhizobiales bacterium 65-79]